MVSMLDDKPWFNDGKGAHNDLVVTVSSHGDISSRCGGKDA